ncbi:alpha/beta hydrolase [Actinoplanes sp. NPDC051851]|uniref:RBBP9/YdeN family alpha/beta hydrolase n=1 Tax=Actinoplanes sp. NPDC051851 TaxID=3154753 RepID=UPI0034444155
MSNARFLILHGWQNRRPANHWQHWLATSLTDSGHAVDYPQLPSPDDPDLEAWLSQLTTHTTALTTPPGSTLPGTTPPGSALPGSADEAAGSTTVICHSLGCLLWLHGAARGLITTPVDQVLLIAPPSASIALANPEIAAFAPPPVTSAQLTAAARYTRLIASNNDPYCPEGAAESFGRPLNLDTDLLPGTSHLNPDSGYGSWPSLLEWCLNPSPSTRITPRA